MEEKRLVPKRRFKDYLENWKLKKISDVGEIIGGGTPNTAIKEYWNGSINWFSPTEIGDKPYVFESQKKITELGLQYSSAKVLPAQKTVLFTSRAGIGDMAILAKDAATNQGFQSIVVKEDSDVYFIYSMGFKIKEYALKNASGSTFLEISGKELSKAPVVVPEVKEQEKIGQFFKVLDKRIVNQEKKIAKVKALKEAYLTEMFPQEGETVPKRRFKGFKGEWNNDILGNILDYEQPTNYIVESDQYNESYPTPVLTAGQSFILGYTNEKVGIKKANDNNPVIIFDDFTTGSHYVNFPFKVKSSALKILSAKIEKVLPYFSYLLLENLKYEPESHERHWISIYSHFNILLPTIEEQEKICTFFKNIDNQIEAEEAKLEKLKQMKEAYLEEMFV